MVVMISRYLQLSRSLDNSFLFFHFLRLVSEK